ncbi:uncharacterized protein UMAG_00074 [Mycosarcoma maydis]|uniref:Nucleolar protein 16 n=1 Tax=Mycosarcoma maydis TaxID=5270 RepID=NOP16_MYCMD|nr:uncharacterized protein UMAG_00074 [Ustilago maydis 521]Q4PII9.1 RecName: Full=Nucleolar protein 16 [Ustilago maydis 521]KIS71633.1 hypothetical protein UMAG_00074 [Ustilago maydis 521]|eukprot:XP_011386042.1 hypothetical protein UMAG_00074 [Ustilago maydis 521]
MANPRQRRKARSGSTLKPSLNAKKQMKKKLARAPTIHGADVLKDNYDPKLTLRQNYARLGLVPSLDVRPNTGGTERAPSSISASSSKEGQAAVRKGMARVIRDDAGNIVDIIEADEHDQDETAWGKPLPSSIADRSDVPTFMPVSQPASNPDALQQLEQIASQAAPVERHTSQKESQWLVELVKKHDDDTQAMAKDRHLNLWQKTEGEIKRAIRKAGGFQALRTSA